ncbi:undecaprenyl-diphosphate phosphatase [Acetobacterium paludosum]|uniref:Undecaprenyl-diphosphatase n=1 Tax=Acetobacterium paludosum TaxID=52693 RepID=A0A923HWR4_9FIRM|nr:undecaprenyl-diphosphate phosphatase [Acetobacterium paludosum]MBC3888039.1 undecaprenyl-diphosphate phosphatase [Acetobacterium paludosum]
MGFIEILKAIILGIVEGITEWLPISSTGHMILVDEFIKLNMSDSFIKMFLYVIQLGAILAVVYIYWHKLVPFTYKDKKLVVRKNIAILWSKILVACLPGIVIYVLLNKIIDELFMNPITVSAMLIFYGILFIVVENYNKKRKPEIVKLPEITYKTALLIGLFQALSIIPGTSRSGVTIIGGMILGTSRTIAAEFTFFMAIPVMFGISFLKLVQFGFAFTGWEVVILLVGMVTAFLTSILAIKFLMNYIKKNNFKIFGWYRIVLGVIVLAYFLISGQL